MAKAKSRENGTRNATLLRTCFGTGLTVTEIALLKVSDYLAENGQILRETQVRPEIALKHKPRPLYWTNNRPTDAIDAHLAELLERGHGWTEAQQKHFIENCLRGVVAGDGLLIQFNCPNFELEGEGDLPAEVQCLVGLPRFTAIERFSKGEINAFGYYAKHLSRTEFSPKRLYVKVAMHTFRWRADLLDHYLAINSGGTTQSASELERVRELLARSASN